MSTAKVVGSGLKYFLCSALGLINTGNFLPLEKFRLGDIY